MSPVIHPIAIVIFSACFGLVTVAGFLASRWRAADLNSLEEWGLAGRKFGTLITWFLIGGDFYTAYTVIAVPAALYGVGAYGFFAIPYCILLYPYMMLVLPKLWAICHRKGYVTLADFVLGRYGSRPLSIAIALTGILATMPYIALQLVGMREVIAKPFGYGRIDTFASDAVEQLLEAATAGSEVVEAQWQGVRDYARAQGIELPFEDDGAALQALLASHRQANQRDFYADLGRRMAPHAQQITAYLQQRQQPQLQPRQTRSPSTRIASGWRASRRERLRAASGGRWR